jgi:hypothetical protein
MTRRLGGLFLAALSSAHGYYHFLQYVNRDGRRIALAERFDLDALPAKSVPYFIARRGPDVFAPGDNLTALVSQLQHAAAQWNTVETSDLKLQFGGFADGRAADSAPPGIDVVFEEVPPGLIAVAGPAVKSEPRPGQNFIPIERSIVILPKDMSNLPSFSEAAFGTFVHEFGHTLGLQHSMTSAAMATELTRSQSRGSALSEDDRAGISWLYPARTFRPNLGVIAGRVTEGASGVALASVTAVSASGLAVGALTHPDGAYRIEGLPPGRYYVYAHPLPPPQAGESSPANLRLPLNPDGTPVQPGPVFQLLFYPGVRDHTQASAIDVQGGMEVTGIDFRVTRRDPLRLYNILAYSFPGQLAVRPAYVNRNGSRHFFVATGVGLLNGNRPTDGLRASVLGGATGIAGVNFYSTGYLRFDLAFTEESGNGFRHLVISTPTDVYVQPRAFVLTDRQPPRIDSVLPGAAAGELAIQGSGLSPATRIFFDGAPAIVRGFDETSGTLRVTPPPAPAGHRAVVTAISRDGQSSLFLQGDAPPTALLDAPSNSGITVTPSRLPAGSESVVEIQGLNTDFAPGRVSVGFGSGDIVVRKAWVISPTRILAQVRVSERAPLVPQDVTVTNGLRTFTAAAAFSAEPPGGARLRVFSLSTNPETGLTTAPAGGTLVFGIGSTSVQPPRVLLGDRPLAVTVLAPSVFAVTVPADAAAGPAVLRISLNSEEALPFAIQVEGPPPRIVEFLDANGEKIDSSRAARIGETVVARLSQPVEMPDPFHLPRVSVNVAGVEHLARLEGDRVTFTLLRSVPERSAPVVVSIDGRLSEPEPLAIR